MRSVLEITAANSGVLLTTAEARTALGITGGARDADIDRLVARVSASIFKACKLATDGIHAPTLLSEEMTETFRLTCNTQSPLRLSRRRVSEVSTVTEAGTELDEDGVEIDRASGLLYKLSSGEPTCWSSGTIVVEYVAGFTSVPNDLKLIAEEWVRNVWRDSYQDASNITDPLLKVEDIPGVLRIERWVDPTKTDALPEFVRSALIDGGYIETWIG